MGVDFLSSNGDTFHFNNAGWRCVTALAEAHGWTDPPGDSDTLSGEQATELADILTRAIGGRSANDLSREVTELLVVHSDSASFSNDPIQLTERTIGYYREFIAFLRRGSVTVT